MKKALYEYAILYHKKVEKENSSEITTEIILAPKTILAVNDQEVGTRAARELPEAHLDHLEQIEIIIRPFA